MYHGHRASAAAAYRVSRFGRGFRLTSGLSLGEMQSKDGADLVKVHPALLALYADLRRRVGPMRINSGYRSPAHNAATPGAASRSLHMYGMALDVVPLRPGVTLDEVAQLARELGAGGVTKYSTFVHVDVAEKRTWAT